MKRSSSWEQPAHLIVIGGGPIGAELAQAQRRLGARVSLLEMNRVLGKDDPDVTVFARRQLIADGVEIHEGIDGKQVAREGNAIAVTIPENGAQSGSEERRVGKEWGSPWRRRGAP